MKFIFISIVFPILLCAELTWQADLEKPFALTIQLHPDTAGISDFIYLKVEVMYPSSYDLDFDALIEQLGWSANPLSPSFTLYRAKVSSQPAEEGVMAKQLNVIIRPHVQGPIYVSLLNIPFQPKEKEGKTIEVTTPVFTMQVESPKGEAHLSLAPLMPLEPQFPLGLTEANRRLLWHNLEREEAELKQIQRAIDRHSFPWLGLLSLIGLGGIAWTAYLIRDLLPKHKREVISATPPKQQAEASLQDLLKQRTTSPLTTFEASELSSILLTALTGPFKRNLKEMTTPEFARVLAREASYSHELQSKLLTFLSEMDLIKFAKKQPSLDESEKLLQDIQSILSQS